jgi:AcrR family transcriptional regulator
MGHIIHIDQRAGREEYQIMGRKNLAEIRREEIIAAFLKVLSEKGFDKATVREIAQTAGCTHRMLHHYFSTKEALVIAAIEDFIASYAPGLEQELLQHNTPTEKIRVFFDLFMNPENFDLSQIRAWVQTWALSDNHPAIQEAAQRWYARIRKIMAEIVREGIETGEFREVDPNTFAELVLESSEGSALLAIMDRNDFTRKSVADARATMYFKYLGCGE